VADVPYQAVVGRLEDDVQRHAELDRAEAAGEVSACRRAERDQLLAQLLRDTDQLGARKAAQVARLADGRQDGQSDPLTLRSSARMATREGTARGFR
jgi:hypothetical protein